MASRDQTNERKLELIGKLAVQRRDIIYKQQAFVQELAESKQQLKDQINIPKLIGSKIKSSFSGNATKWFVGSAIGGLIISKFIFRSSNSSEDTIKSASSPVSKNLLLTLFGMAARPLLKNFFIGKAKDYLARRFLTQQQQLSHYDYHNEHLNDSDYYNY